MRDGLFVKVRSSKLLYLVGSSWTWVRLWSIATSTNFSWTIRSAASKSTFDSFQLMLGQLKSPHKIICLFLLSFSASRDFLNIEGLGDFFGACSRHLHKDLYSLVE